MTTSEMIKKLCDAKNISISELARRLGQSPQNFGKKLKRETVTLEELMQIAELTGVSFEQNFVLENGDRISTGDVDGKAQARRKLNASTENDIKTILLNISHELRTPLNTIVGFADMVMNAKGNYERLADYTGKIKLSAESITKLVDNMTEMASLDQTVDDETEILVNTQSALEKFSRYASEYVTRHNVKLNCEFKGVGDTDFYCDSAHVNKVIKIILAYAVQFAHKDGFVDLVMEQFDVPEPGHIGIRCIVTNKADTIDPITLDKIKSIINDEKCSFNWMEFNAEQLELAIVRKNMNRLGGKINMTSDEENGTQVVMEFFFKSVDSRQDEESSETALAGKKILVVEDNALNRDILKELLSIVGITTEQAEDGIDAVEKVRTAGKNYYDAILMDIQMPRMDGYEATKKIREICGDRKIPVIAVTANAFDEDRQKSIECGLDAHVSKPVDYNKLLVLLKKFMSGKR